MKGPFLCLLGLFTVVYGESHHKSITTDSGIIEGKLNKLEVLGTEVYEFLGIPFAEPPVGDLRFKKPVAKAPWQGTLQAFDFPNSCPQLMDTFFTNNFKGETQWKANTPISEDCLYLNIWVPRRVMESSEKQAVMIMIHGGGFTAESSSIDLYTCAGLAAVGNVIVVSFNYRLGSLGFLYLGTEEAPGNMGLWDQTLAMQWVYDNIQHFNGDNERTTLFGDSAGGAAVGFHLLSPHSEKLFSRAILQSSSALSDWAFVSQEQGLWRSEKLFRVFSSGCSLPNSSVSNSDMIKCLLSQPYNRFPEEDYGVLADKEPYGYCQFPFVAVIDGDFLPDHPRKLLASGQFKKADLIGGFTRNEGTYFMIYSLLGLDKLQHPDAMDQQMNFTERDYQEFTKEFFGYYPKYNTSISEANLTAIMTRYQTPSMTTQQVIDAVDASTGDWTFVCPVVEWLDAYSEADYSQMYQRRTYEWIPSVNSPNNMNMWGNIDTSYQFWSNPSHESKNKIFMYQFAQRASNQYWPEWMGVMHADDMAFVSGHPFFSNLSDPYTFKEQLLSWKIMTYWSNFAKSGNPNTEGPSNDDPKEDETFWPEYTSTRKISLELSVAAIVDKEKSSTSLDLKTDSCKFWKEMATLAYGDQVTPDRNRLLLRPTAQFSPNFPPLNLFQGNNERRQLPDYHLGNMRQMMPFVPTFYQGRASPFGWMMNFPADVFNFRQNFFPF